MWNQRALALFCAWLLMSESVVVSTSPSTSRHTACCCISLRTCTSRRQNESGFERPMLRSSRSDGSVAPIASPMKPTGTHSSCCSVNPHAKSPPDGGPLYSSAVSAAERTLKVKRIE